MRIYWTNTSTLTTSAFSYLLSLTMGEFVLGAIYNYSKPTETWINFVMILVFISITLLGGAFLSGIKIENNLEG